MIGRVLSGRYEIQAVVGTGGMAVVYRAWDKTEKRTVAIKVLRPEYEQDEEFVRRFSREAEAAAKMSHENIVNLLDVGKDNDMRYIVMEYVPGKTLKDLIRERGRIAPDTARRPTCQLPSSTKAAMAPTIRPSASAHHHWGWFSGGIEFKARGIPCSSSKTSPTSCQISSISASQALRITASQAE